MSQRLALPKDFGRGAFGADPDAYERARPAYPEAIYDVLRDRCGLKPGISVLEIGPGPGMVTKRLFDAGVASVTAVEPDARLVQHLCRRYADAMLTVIQAPFEEAAVPSEAFELAVCGTAFHWVDREAGVPKVADALKPGGWWACWWNFFGDNRVEDDFFKATAHLFQNVPRNHDVQIEGDKRPFGLQTELRLADLAAEPRFEDARSDDFTWTVTMSEEQVCALFASFSPIVALTPQARADFFAGLRKVVREEFGGTVEKTMTAALYTARRR